MSVAPYDHTVDDWNIVPVEKCHASGRRGGQDGSKRDRYS